MVKKLISDRRFCSGCLACVVNCSQFHEGHAAPSSSRIQIDLDPFTGDYISLYCTQCEEKVCVDQCPSGAIEEDAAGNTKINYDVCIGCQACIAACPHGAVFYDSVTDKVIKCDACGGDPQCAKACYTGALLWIEPEEADSFEKEKMVSRYFCRKEPRS